MKTAVILKRFKELGLTAHEAKSYLSLLERDTLTVSEISRIAGIARPNAYESLEKLLAKGLCSSLPGKTKKYSACDPSLLKGQIFEQINKNLDEDIEEHKKKIYQALNKKEKETSDKKKIAAESMNTLIKELSPLYKNSRNENTPLDYIEIIKDSYQINKRFKELANEAKKEILGFSKPPYSVPKKGLEEQVEQQADRRMREKIRIRGIYEIPKSKEEIQWQFDILNRRERGSITRVINELPMKMVIFDEKIVLLPLEDPISGKTSFTAQVIEHRALAKSLKMLFEHVWEQAEDYHILEDLLKKM